MADNTLPISPNELLPSLDPAATRTLSRRADTRLLTPAREHGYELRLLGATVLPRGQVIHRTRQGAWLLTEYKHDPTAASYGGRIPIPAEPHARLTALAAAGVAPDHVWLAHQLPEDWQPGQPADVLVPDPRHLRERDENLMRGLTAASRTAVRVLAVGGLALGAMALAPLAMLDGVGLDPVVLGGVQRPELPVVVWVELARWEWQ
jgi:hypothetical protein